METIKNNKLSPILETILYFNYSQKDLKKLMINKKQTKKKMWLNRIKKIKIRMKFQM